MSSRLAARLTGAWRFTWSPAMDERLYRFSWRLWTWAHGWLCRGCWEEAQER